MAGNYTSYRSQRSLYVHVQIIVTIDNHSHSIKLRSSLQFQSSASLLHEKQSLVVRCCVSVLDQSHVFCSFRLEAPCQMCCNHNTMSVRAFYNRNCTLSSGKSFSSAPVLTFIAVLMQTGSCVSAVNQKCVGGKYFKEKCDQLRDFKVVSVGTKSVLLNEE